jgi:hypothetical protein
MAVNEADETFKRLVALPGVDGKKIKNSIKLYQENKLANS